MIPAQEALRALANPEKAAFFPRFFKSGPGQYGEGDKFIGVTVPLQRSVVKQFSSQISFSDLTQMLQSEWHEDRLTALLILVDQYKKARKNQVKRKEIITLYLANLTRVNNWDLVDSSAPYLIGEAVRAGELSEEVLWKLANSGHLWSERVAMVSTFAFLRKGNGSTYLTFALAEHFLSHNHDLMHKAVGWALREAGKYEPQKLRDFLTAHASIMPRTALRYAIEHFPVAERKAYLAMRT